jgi:hypothetical protein
MKIQSADNTVDGAPFIIKQKPTIDQIVYTFNSVHGKVIVEAADITKALEEQSAKEYDAMDHTEDLMGWSLIHATDENGKSRPFCIMRTLPGNNVPLPYNKVALDDKAMGELIMSEIYKLTKRKLWWLRFKHKIKTMFRRDKKALAAPKAIKQPKDTSKWIQNIKPIDENDVYKYKGSDSR